MNILLLCTGNICRSPMAEALFRRLAPSHEVFSAGICAQEGAPADPISVELMWQIDIDISAHRARQLGRWMMREADLVLVMERMQQRWVHSRYPSVATKVELLGGAGSPDIPDPYRQGLPEFQHALKLIRDGVRSRVAKLRQGSLCSIC